MVLMVEITHLIYWNFKTYKGTIEVKKLGFRSR